MSESRSVGRSRARVAVRAAAALAVVVLGCAIAACRPSASGDTESSSGDLGVFDPMVGALDRAHQLDGAADEHNQALDDALGQTR